MEETLASYLSVGEASSLKAPSLHLSPFKVRSSRSGCRFIAHDGAAQADLLKDLDKGQGLSSDEVAELGLSRYIAIPRY